MWGETWAVQGSEVSTFGECLSAPSAMFRATNVPSRQVQSETAYKSLYGYCIALGYSGRLC